MGPAVKETLSTLPVEVEVEKANVDEVKTNSLAEEVIKLLNKRDERLIALIESSIREFPKNRNDTATLFEIYALFIRKMRRMYSRFYPHGPQGVMLAVEYRLNMLNPERLARYSSVKKLNHRALAIDLEPENIKFLSILAECLEIKL